MANQSRTTDFGGSSVVSSSCTTDSGDSQSWRFYLMCLLQSIRCFLDGGCYLDLQISASDRCSLFMTFCALAVVNISLATDLDSRILM
uniref:Uncharacterized protein n=1 Tax=Kalanchoe fedtschenkoi TaxID=63787 RepID=A0A7N0TKY1_KALFE